MGKINFMQVIEPDYKIQIGIKDGKVISLHWGEVIDNEKLHDNNEIFKKVEKYLREAIKYHNKR